MNNQHHIKGYDYEICAYLSASGKYHGMILVKGHSGMSYSPIVEIQTPTAFRAQRAAQIEADALALELIHTGAITALLPPESSGSCFVTASNLFLRTKE